MSGGKMGGFGWTQEKQEAQLAEMRQQLLALASPKADRTAAIGFFSFSSLHFLRFFFMIFQKIGQNGASSGMEATIV